MENRPERTIYLEDLRRRIARLETGARRPADDPPVSTGCDILDHLLPERGFRRGALVEWLSPGEGTGAGTLALLAAREACNQGGVVVVFDCRREFCPAAAVRLGIKLEQLIVVHADNRADNDWAMDQALRSPAVAAAVAWPKQIDARTFRRWQLAAEEGGCLGLLLRPAAARDEPSWADVRLWVEPLPMTLQKNHGCATPFGIRRCLRIIVLRCRGGTDGRSVEVELDDETHRMHPLEERRLQMAN